MSFNYWYNEVADIPSQREDGTWEDLETGETFAHWAGGQEERPKKLRTHEEERKLAQAKEIRKAAKAMGGKALKGSPKQKAWAEKIRKDILDQVPKEAADLMLKSESICGHSKFWIDNRAKSASDFASFIIELANIVHKANALNAAGDNGEEYKELVKKHGQMLATWNII